MSDNMDFDDFLRSAIILMTLFGCILASAVCATKGCVLFPKSEPPESCTACIQECHGDNEAQQMLSEFTNATERVNLFCRKIYCSEVCG